MEIESGASETGLHKSLTVSSTAGLSNRLRVLLSGKAIAEATGREFAMRWRPTEACGCTFDRLFQNEWNVHVDTFFDYKNVYDLSNAPYGSFPEWLSLNDPAVFVFHFSFLFQPARFSRHRSLLERAQQLMRELKPVDPLLNRIEKFRECLFRACMIGVHLRRGDLMHHRPDTTANLEVMLEQVDTWLEQVPDAGILLCTDDGSRNPFTHHSLPTQNIRSKFMQRYGERVVMTEPNLDRGKPQAIEDALVELWLLRATQFFAGTRGSSFSEMAVFGRDIPYAQLAASTRSYQRQVRWLKRLGLYNLIARMAYYELGREAPYAQLLHRNLRRLRIFLTGRY
ncbi:MAG: hypothetical protein JXA73_07850 [Acidobacteria bacterium]|nr:hypothetical protein [Acidobacteriota bacterium]